MLFSIILLHMAIAEQTDHEVLRKPNDNPIADVSAALNRVQTASPTEWSANAPDVVECVRNAVAIETRSHALRVLVSRCDGPRVAQCVDIIKRCIACSDAVGCERAARLATLETFLRIPCSQWSGELRASTLIHAEIKKVATASPAALGLPPHISESALERLLELCTDNEQRRALLLEVFASGNPCADLAVYKLIPIIDNDTKQRLRNMLQGPRPNIHAIKLLGEIGDQSSRAIAQEQFERFQSLGHQAQVLTTFLREAIWKIDVQNPPSNLLEVIRAPEQLWYRDWAIRKAVERGIQRDIIRQAVLDLASLMNPMELVLVKNLCLELDVVNPSDLPNVPALNSLLPGLAGEDNDGSPRAESTSQPIGRLPRKKPWKPNEANNEAIAQWMMTIDWDALPEEQASQMLRQKLCELDLIPPDECAALATTQPAP